MSASVPHNEWTAETTTPAPVRLLRLGDERLAWLAARGSTRAFAAVYDRYHQPLYRYCRSIVRDDADAQDALQSTFTRALSALKRDRRNAPLRPWLFRIAHNESISVLRRRPSGGGSDPLEAATFPSAPSAEDQAGERARMAMLMDDLAALPNRARNALLMRELSGLSHEDIAFALDISEGAAKQAIFEARRGLHECAEGRAMLCAEVSRAISDGDRRVIRGRRIRAHLRDCASCAAFASAIETRQAELRAFVPVLPAAASAAVLASVTQAGAGGAGAGGGGAVVAGAAGKTLGIAMGGKSFAAASLLATAAVSVGGVAAVVRLSHDGRPAVAVGGGHAAVARPAVHRASAARGLPPAASVRVAPGVAPGTRATVVAEPATRTVALPSRTISVRTHRRSARSHGGPIASGYQSTSLTGGRGASSSHRDSATSASRADSRPSSSHGNSESSSHGASAPSNERLASLRAHGHTNGAASGRPTGNRTPPERANHSGRASQRGATVPAVPNGVSARPGK